MSPEFQEDFVLDFGVSITNFLVESEPKTRRFRFGVFQLDALSGELYKHGTRIKLQDQPFQVLAMLLDRPGEVVTREELRKGIWNHDTYVDFDHSLNISVNKLRDALGDSAATPRFIETLPRRGYRFIAPVSAEDPAPQPVSAVSAAVVVTSQPAQELGPSASGLPEAVDSHDADAATEPLQDQPPLEHQYQHRAGGHRLHGGHGADHSAASV